MKQPVGGKSWGNWWVTRSAVDPTSAGFSCAAVTALKDPLNCCRRLEGDGAIIGNIAGRGNHRGKQWINRWGKQWNHYRGQTVGQVMRATSDTRSVVILPRLDPVVHLLLELCAIAVASAAV